MNLKKSKKFLQNNFIIFIAVFTLLFLSACTQSFANVSELTAQIDSVWSSKNSPTFLQQLPYSFDSVNFSSDTLTQIQTELELLKTEISNYFPTSEKDLVEQYLAINLEIIELRKRTIEIQTQTQQLESGLFSSGFSLENNSFTACDSENISGINLLKQNLVVLEEKARTFQDHYVAWAVAYQLSMQTTVPEYAISTAQTGDTLFYFQTFQELFSNTCVFAGSLKTFFQEFEQFSSQENLCQISTLQSLKEKLNEIRNQLIPIQQERASLMQTLNLDFNAEISLGLESKMQNFFDVLNSLERECN
ncbi:MAG: hypothetical protein Q7S92_00800 [Candidatus Diapherotrites archaeon]|nr:hypothetical protein [Candidatus Diapherotrites archaeon]